MRRQVGLILAFLLLLNPTSAPAIPNWADRNSFTRGLWSMLEELILVLAGGFGSLHEIFSWLSPILWVIWFAIKAIIMATDVGELDAVSMLSFWLALFTTIGFLASGWLSSKLLGVLS